MVDIWLRSDDHADHENIIKFCDRPFKDVKEMADSMVEWHNELVKPQDHVYFLGDVVMGRGTQTQPLDNYLKRMNGHKRLIMGNHDHYHVKYYMKWFEKIMAMNVIDNLRLIHIPLHPTSFGGVKATIHGHIHNKDSPDPITYYDKYGVLVVKPYINVCVERTAYKPIHLDEVKGMVNSVIRKIENEVEDD